MSQYQENATVTRVEQFTSENYRLTLHSPQIAEKARPGQFVMIRTGLGQDPLLRRPFSIHQTSNEGIIQIYFKVVGRGTDILARVKIDEIVSIFGPLGRGYRLEEKKRSIIVGGGLGIAPLLFLAKENCKRKKDCFDDVIILGGRNKAELEPLLDDFKKFGLALFTATDDGSLGHHGFVTEIFESLEIRKGDRVYSCGPEPMLTRLSDLCKKRSVVCEVSVESIMACGMGACLGCSRIGKDGKYTHVCLNGPVYNAEELVWNI